MVVSGSWFVYNDCYDVFFWIVVWLLVCWKFCCFIVGRGFFFGLVFSGFLFLVGKGELG